MSRGPDNDPTNIIIIRYYLFDVIFSECHLDFRVGLGMGDSYIALIFYNILVYIRLILVKGKL